MSADGPAGHDHHDHGHSEVPEDVALRVRSLQSLLVEKGLVDQSALDRVMEAYEHRIGPHLGARVVARAWVDPAFRARLLEDGTAAVGELGMEMRGGTRIVVVENTVDVHNLVVCTLCSCYPLPLLGLPPVWYKSAAYRSRAVSDPRSVLEEFGTQLPGTTEVRVWDSNSEVRYLVLPERPTGTEGQGEEELAGLVGRNAMIGVERVAPAPAAA